MIILCNFKYFRQVKIDIKSYGNLLSLEGGEIVQCVKVETKGASINYGRGGTKKLGKNDLAYLTIPL